MRRDSCDYGQLSSTLVPKFGLDSEDLAAI
jgi:hypothetical protein